MHVSWTSAHYPIIVYDRFCFSKWNKSILRFRQRTRHSWLGRWLYSKQTTENAEFYKMSSSAWTGQLLRSRMCRLHGVMVRSTTSSLSVNFMAFSGGSVYDTQKNASKRAAKTAQLSALPRDLCTASKPTCSRSAMYAAIIIITSRRLKVHGDASSPIDFCSYLVLPGTPSQCTRAQCIHL